MGLKIKSFQEILRSMADWVVMNTKKITDFHVGSAIRTLLEAVSAELEQLYYSMYKNIKYAIENAVFKAFGFEKQQASYAYGDLTLYFSYPLRKDLVIPKGTRFATAEGNEVGQLIFETNTDYTVVEGSTEAVIRVYCTTPGVNGNITANSIKIMMNPIREVSEVNNLDGFKTGKEEESLAERKQRFNRYIETLSKGTLKSIEYGVKEVTGVAGVWVEEEIGLVKVYAHDANGDLDSDLKEKIIENLKNYRPAGIPVEVFSIEKMQLDLDVKITVSSAFNTDDFKEYLIYSIDTYLNSFPVAQNFIVSDLVRFIMDFDTVAIKNCKVLSPTDDIVVAKQKIIRPKSINVTLVTE